jgi:acetoin utilization deacetylase AcuC-like enzyme
VIDNESFSPSAGKPRQVLESWIEKRLPVDIREPSPCSMEDLCLAHSREYVEGVLNCTISNGFDNKKPSVAESLPWTTGSMVSAAVNSLHTGSPSVRLSSGFHHAGSSRGGGFCTFNGLIVATMILLNSGKAKKIGILDLDCHYGNGTEDIIRTLQSKHQISQDSFAHYTFGTQEVSPANSQDWLDYL